MTGSSSAKREGRCCPENTAGDARAPNNFSPFWEVVERGGSYAVPIVSAMRRGATRWSVSRRPVAGRAEKRPRRRR